MFDTEWYRERKAAWQVSTKDIYTGKDNKGKIDQFTNTVVVWLWAPGRRYYDKVKSRKVQILHGQCGGEGKKKSNMMRAGWFLINNMRLRRSPPYGRCHVFSEAPLVGRTLSGSPVYKAQGYLPSY